MQRWQRLRASFGVIAILAVEEDGQSVREGPGRRPWHRGSNLQRSRSRLEEPATRQAGLSAHRASKKWKLEYQVHECTTNGEKQRQNGKGRSWRATLNQDLPEKSDLQRGLDLEAPSLKKWLGNVLR